MVDETIATATRPDPYPDNWPEIATRIKEAAGWCCELRYSAKGNAQAGLPLDR